MPLCCRCNGNGRCRDCKCKKASRHCINCLPSRKNQCVNLSKEDAGIPAETSEEIQDEEIQDSSLGNQSQVLQGNQSQILIEAGSNHDLSVLNAIPDLPDYQPLNDDVFMWGRLESSEFSLAVNGAYNEVVRWRYNLFEIPRGRVGSLVVEEISRLLEAYATNSALEGIAMKAAMILPALMLQRPHHKSKAKDHVRLLECRLTKWKDGEITTLLHECQTIQNRISTNSRRIQNKDSLARAFQKLVSVGNVKAALRLITEQGSDGCLSLDSSQPDGRSVRDHIMDKHPSGKQADPNAISTEVPADDPHPIVFDRIDGPMVRQVVHHLSGSAGPSGTNARAWKRMCTSFHRSSDGLCEAIAKVTRKVCSTYVNAEGLAALVACRLIAIDKCPGIRPIGIGECLRRLIGKLALKVARQDILQATGVSQLCTGHESACEAGILAMMKIYEEENSEAVLLVDATNAFNSINRQAVLRNVRIHCPILAPIVVNSYRLNPNLFIDGEAIQSREGITQGDPLAMVIYAIATLPLIRKIQNEAKQSWYADDAAAGGSLSQLRKWWDNLNEAGPQFGYFPNPSKTWLIVKPQHWDKAEEMFKDTGIEMTTEGRRYLGGGIGRSGFLIDYVKEKVKQWVGEVEALSNIAQTQPQAAYAAFTHGLMSRWTFIMRTIPGTGDVFQPLEDAIRFKFLTALTGRSAFSDVERELLALPVRLGGLGITMPTSCRERHFQTSVRICEPLVSLILQHDESNLPESQSQQREERNAAHQSNRQRAEEDAKAIHPRLSKSQQTAREQASEKGASSWLSTLPIVEHGFNLHKQAFRDALSIRYGWQLTRIPSHCLCGTPNSVGHALSRPKGALPSIRHNRIRDLTASLMTEVCPNVSIEPVLQPLSGETFRHQTSNTQDNARLDIRTQDFWDKSKKSSFFDVRVFNSHAPSNQMSPSACYRRHEMEKRRMYERRVLEVEQGYFTPLVMSTSGGWGPSATMAYKRLASLLAEKLKQPYSLTLNYIRCKISFSLIDSVIMCVRGARSSFHQPAKDMNVIDTPLDLIANEACLS